MYLTKRMICGLAAATVSSLLLATSTLQLTCDNAGPATLNASTEANVPMPPKKPDANERDLANSIAGPASSSPTPLLDLIGYTEGTDRADGYNETLAYGAFTGGNVTLTQMSLKEIDQLQTQMLAHPGNKWNSSAVGRYQIVRTTLRKLKKRLKIHDDVKFTAALQDRLAEALLRWRGYVAWTSGRLSDHQFAYNLSKEWASLPNPKTGKGYYSGQRAAVDYATVQRVFGQVRDHMGS